jgi:hypothetical protein
MPPTMARMPSRKLLAPPKQEGRLAICDQLPEHLEGELSPAEWAAVLAVLNSEWAWTSVSTLTGELGHDQAVVDELVSRQVLAPFDLSRERVPKTQSKMPPPIGACVSLTELWSFRLRVEVVEVGSADRPRFAQWCYTEDGERTRDEGLPPLIDQGHGGCRLKLPEAVPDPTPEPIDLLIEQEEPTVLIDPWSDKPIALLGQETIPIDERVGKPRKKVSKKKAKKRRKSRVR